jgi:hypothetical protein
VCVASSCSATMCLWCSETMCVCGEVEGLLWVERRKEGSKEEAKGCCVLCVWGLVSFMNLGFFSGFYLWCSQSGDHSTKLFNLAKISWLHTRYQSEKTFLNKNQIQNPSIFLATYLPTYWNLSWKSVYLNIILKLFSQNLANLCLFFPTRKPFL